MIYHMAPLKLKVAIRQGNPCIMNSEKLYHVLDMFFTDSKRETKYTVYDNPLKIQESLKTQMTR